MYRYIIELKNIKDLIENNSSYLKDSKNKAIPAMWLNTIILKEE